MNNKIIEEQLKMVGGKIPITLYWEFKEAQAKRSENATTALEHAIRLYIELPLVKINDGEV